MDDVPSAHVDTHMDDAACFVGEETKVVASSLLQIWNHFSLSCLLGSVAEQSFAASPETYLSQSGAVDAHDGATAPKVRGS